MLLCNFVYTNVLCSFNMSDGESPKLSSDTGSPLSDATSHESKDQSDSRTEESISFDLSDPNDLETKLENLSEHEMEELLKQAYKVNKELKKELEKQEQPHFTSKKEKEKSKTASSSKSGTRSKQPESEVSLPPLRRTSGNRLVGPRGFTSLNHRADTYSSHGSPPVTGSRQKVALVLSISHD
ncbi:hypothetical protein EB796_017418 [Bugula neritina]|uniref:Uncharacterized protein n=1 Tax=Bugula neritina TaxID=10212 RepID=A0A7J7JE24_BUGNE|nr:hypothetical protein EB796_017418 [Bugula neritina]